MANGIAKAATAEPACATALEGRQRLLGRRPRRTFWRLFGIFWVLAAVGVGALSCGGGKHPPPPPPPPDASPQAHDLTDLYAPVLYLSRQDVECDVTIDTDPYDPIDVGVFLDKADARLMTNERPPTRDSVRKTGPSQADLYGSSPKEYVDVLKDSHARNPSDRCNYERASNQAGGRRTVYARVSHVDDRTVLQYWFFYYFDDWTNRHEGDWELIQLLFRASSAADVLSRSVAPEWVDFSQHTSGHRYQWSDPGLERSNSTHAVVYVGSGSHANYAKPGFWYTAVKRLDMDVLGGCDLAPSPEEARKLENGDGNTDGHYQLEVVASPASASDPFAWTPFSGAWGELSIPGFSGADAPFYQTQGAEPLKWGDKLAKGSIERCVRREGGQRGLSPGSDFLHDLQQVTEHPAIVVGDVITFIVTWGGSDVTVRVVSPTGKEFTSPTKKGDDYAVYRIEDGEPGTWTLDIVPHFPDGDELVTWEAWDDPPVCNDDVLKDKAGDADLDGLSNGDEVSRNLDPCDWDSKHDGTSDGPAAGKIVIEALPDVVPCDAVESASVTVRVTDGNDNPVPDGTVVEFRILSGGTLRVERVETKSGRATVAATPSGDPAGMRVEARVGAVSATVAVRCAAGIYLRFTPPTVVCDGKASATLTATIVLDTGRPAPDGTAVIFSVVALGTADPTKAETSKGVASTRITPLSNSTAGVTVTVSTADLQTSIRLDCTR